MNVTCIDVFQLLIYLAGSVLALNDIFSLGYNYYRRRVRSTPSYSDTGYYYFFVVLLSLSRQVQR
jgi:hypothetical protein